MAGRSDAVKEEASLRVVLLLSQRGEQLPLRPAINKKPASTGCRIPAGSSVATSAHTDIYTCVGFRGVHTL